MQDRAEVEAMLRAGRPFGQIEDRIEGMRVSEEAKSALWLLAWIEQEAHTQRRILEDERTDLVPAG
jgi:hypothetical protein